MSSLVFSFQWNIALNRFNHNPSSSIVNEVIRAIFFFFHEDILHTKKAYKALMQRLLRYSYTPKSITKITGDFNLDITPKNIKKQATFYPDVSIRLKKMPKNSGS